MGVGYFFQTGATVKHLPAAAVLLLSLVALWFRPSPAAIVAQAQPSAPHGTREAWAYDLLSRLGNSSPTPATVRMVVEWTIAEDAGPGAFARNNPHNTTLCLPGRMTGAINGDGACGVQGYATRADGLDATVLTLASPLYAEIVAALQANDPERAKQALWASPWAESHYGYGAAWPQE